jgi:hypothetical protein
VAVFEKDEGEAGTLCGTFSGAALSVARRLSDATGLKADFVEGPYIKP